MRVYLDGGCSDFDDHMSKGDDASYCDEVDGGKREAVEGVEWHVAAPSNVVWRKGVRWQAIQNGLLGWGDRVEEMWVYG